MAEVVKRLEISEGIDLGLGLLVEFKRATKKRIGPSTRFYVHNFSRPRTRFDLAYQGTRRSRGV